MKKSVKVTTHPETGNIVTPFEGNPEFGAVGVEQEVTTYGDNGFMNRSRRTALIRGRVEDLEEQGFSAGQVLPGKIIVKEGLEQAYDGQNPKINPTSGEILTKGDQPIYRQTFYTEDMSASDKLIQHSVENETVTENAQAQTVNEELAV